MSRNVWMLGFTSLATDVSSEMVASVLPLYLLFHLHLSPATFGLVDGLQQGGASLARVVSGVVTDRWRRHKPVAALGYGVSAACRLALLAAGANGLAVTLVTAADRIGKGIRTSPRDALIARSVPGAALASAFGVHRTLDTIGAMLGPLLAFALLRLTRDDFTAVFVVSFAAAVVGVSLLLAFVAEAPAAVAEQAAPPAAVAWRDPDVRLLAACALGLGASAVGDSLVYVALQRQASVPAGWLPLLFVATPAAFAVAAGPLGWLADSLGRARILAAGHAALVCLYAVLLSGVGGPLAVAATVVLLGVYYAATDGVLPALTSRVLPEPARATTLSMVGTAHDAGRLLASLVFGWVWAGVSIRAALGWALVVAVVAVLVPARRLARFQREREGHD